MLSDDYNDEMKMKKKYNYVKTIMGRNDVN